MARVYIETYGCALNRGDTNIMETVLMSRGHVIVDSVDSADVIIINTCTVRMETQQRMIHRIKVLWKITKGTGKKLVVAGCLPAAQPYKVALISRNISLISPQNSSRIYVAVESDEPVYLLNGSRDRRILGRVLLDRIAVVPIQEGCLGNCSFCIVKNARRRLASYPIEVVTRTTKDLVKEGAIEIELTGQDTGAYGIDIYGRQRLPELVNAVATIPGNFMVRIGMINPDTLEPIIDDIIEVLRHPKVYKFLHIPIQSGSDKVLKIMRRKYTVDRYRALIRELRRKIPGIAIATDIIVGHPGEDEEDFEMTLSIIKELMFERVHVAQYTIRPNTYAASLRQISSKIKKERVKKLMKVVEEVGLAINREYIGKRVYTLVTEGSPGNYTARLFNYTPVVLHTTRMIKGKWVSVDIFDASFYDLRGIAVA